LYIHSNYKHFYPLNLLANKAARSKISAQKR